MVTRLSDASYLAWFQRAWREAPEDLDGVSEWLEEELGTNPYGLWSIFVARSEHDLPAPATTAELRDMLFAHLYVEGGPEGQVGCDEHSLRVITDNDDYGLAYYFFDDAIVRERPDRLAFAVYDGDDLPPADGAGDGGGIGGDDDAFEIPTAPHDLLPSGQGEGFVLAFYQQSLETGWLREMFTPYLSVWRGVRLPDLADHLRTVAPAESAYRLRGTRPSRTPRGTWSEPWLALRAALPPSGSLRDAAETLWCNEIVLVQDRHVFDLALPHAAAHEKLADVTEPPHAPLLPEVRAGEHHLVAFVPSVPMILVDDVWAASHPNLARSLAVWAWQWDPLAPLEPKGR
jgi:hypothetical protein